MCWDLNHLRIDRDLSSMAHRRVATANQWDKYIRLRRNTDWITILSQLIDGCSGSGMPHGQYGPRERENSGNYELETWIGVESEKPTEEKVCWRAGRSETPSNAISELPG